MRFTVKPKKITLGKRQGQTGYQCVPEGNSKLSLQRLIDVVVDETSLGAGDVRNAIITMTKIARRYLMDGISIDLGELGSFRVLVPSKVLSDPLEVTAATALKKPKIVYTPRQDLREAVEGMRLQVTNPYRQTNQTTTTGGDNGQQTGGSTGGDTPGGSGNDNPGGGGGGNSGGGDAD